jgi:ribosomal protein L11 methyltransferase
MRTGDAGGPPSHPFRVLAPRDAALAAGPLDLVVDPSAFGGGTHSTTASCLALLAELAPLEGARVLDLGSGSGILAIAAVRLGAARATCLDVNPDAVASARRNGERNGVADRLGHRCGTAADLAGESFDLVVANVGGELLVDEAERIAPLAAPGGRLVLSGLLAGWAGELEAAYARQGCAVVARRAPDAFCAVLLRRA